MLVDRTKLQVERRIRDLAMFNLAIDSKLRGCDVVSLTVEDVAPNGVAINRATVRQKKTGHPDRFELSEQTREAVDDYIRGAHKKAGALLLKSTSCQKWMLTCVLVRQGYGTRAKNIKTAKMSTCTMP
jgi:integrase